MIAAAFSSSYYSRLALYNSAWFSTTQPGSARERLAVGRPACHSMIGATLTRYAEPLVFILRTVDLVKTLSITLELVRKVIKDLV